MDKRVWRIVTIRIIETWTITWADGTEQTVVYQEWQPDHLLPTNPNKPQDWAELETQ